MNNEGTVQHTFRYIDHVSIAYHPWIVWDMDGFSANPCCLVLFFKSTRPLDPKTMKNEGFKPPIYGL